MREAYLPPELIRVASVEDLTLASGQGGLLDVCIMVSPPNGAQIGVSDLNQCFS